MNADMRTGQGKSRRELFDTIGAVSFFLDDLRLYLDTHPDDAEALGRFKELQQKRHSLIAEYTSSFGSIDSYYVNTENGWDWNDCPIPWRGEAN